MKLLEQGWNTCHQQIAEATVVLAGGSAIGNLLAYNLRLNEVVVDVCYPLPGNFPGVAQPIHTHRLRLAAPLEAYPSGSKGKDPMVDLFWTGEGWLDHLSWVRTGPLVLIVQAEVAGQSYPDAAKKIMRGMGLQ